MKKNMTYKNHLKEIIQMKTKLFFALILVVFLVAPIWAKGPNGPSTSPDLTIAEKANILYLFEEEKLAHDIYVAMYNLYGAYIFNNISESEQRHMDSVAKLIYKYELEDTVVNNGPGVFLNEEIEILYGDLLEEGGKSLTSALRVGVKIEEMDIADIQKMQLETEKADIDRVLTNLLDGSYNHLDAFNNQLGLIP
jgi:hypothetical protein